MIANLASRARGFFSGVGAKALGRAGGSTLVANKARAALGSTVRFAVAHPMIAGAGLGAVGGYAGSMGDPGGALAGAAIGAGLGRGGIMRYDFKRHSARGGRLAQALNKKGGKVGGFLAGIGMAPGGLNKMRHKLAGSVGRKISRKAPGIAEAYGMKKSVVSYDVGQGMKNMTQRVRMSTYKVQDAMGELDISVTPMRGHARNTGGKRLGMLAVGGAMTVGAGALGGIGYNVATEPIKSAGRTFGSQMTSVYGNAFSGMGNGTITGY